MRLKNYSYNARIYIIYTLYLYGLKKFTPSQKWKAVHLRNDGRNDNYIYIIYRQRRR